MTQRKLISIVIPCYNEEENINNTYKEVKRVLATLPNYEHEIIFVDNGSMDQSAALMKKLAREDPKVVAVLLSRNFGPEASGLAGLRHAHGEAIIPLPADLQEPPSLIPQFIKKWEEGYDLVLGQTQKTEDNFLIGWFRRFFYKLLKETSYIDIPRGVTGFGLYDARVNREVIQMPERHRFHRGLLAWAGFRRTFIPYDRQARKYGKSSYSFFNYLKSAESGLVAFSNVPLDFITYLGLFFVFLSVISIIIYIAWVLVAGNPIQGSATLFLGIMFFGGIQVLAISVVGKYIAIIFEETKNRPNYIVKEVVTQNKHERTVEPG
jgi:glycosyltransferase involved in cell wall biosynthesis